MDELDRLLECTPIEKLIDVLQNAPRGAVENTIINLCKEVIALKILLENSYVDIDDKLEKFIFENDLLLEEKSNDIYIDLTAKILGHEG